MTPDEIIILMRAMRETGATRLVVGDLRVTMQASGAEHRASDTYARQERSFTPSPARSPEEAGAVPAPATLAEALASIVLDDEPPLTPAEQAEVDAFERWQRGGPAPDGAPLDG